MTDEVSPADAGATSTAAAASLEIDVVLPWWRSPLNLAVVLLAAVVLAAGIGYVVGNNRALPDPGSTDIGFLQDMRVHHEQAVQMSLIYLDRPDTAPTLQTTAREIVVGQNMEIGRMIQLLRGFGASEVNETDVGMAWMDEPVALDRMPGLATEDDIDALRRAVGPEADEVFVALMTAHHQGGVHMAEHASEHATTDEVRRMARSMALVQTEEIEEMAALLAASQQG